MKFQLRNPFKTGTAEPAAAALRDQVVVVSGLPRSGTSMMMKLLEAGGLEALTDNIRTADVDNPKGYYEFERVKALDKGDKAWLPEARGKVVKVISALLRHLPDTEQYKIIFIHRQMDEILASQKKMLARRGEPVDQVSDEELARLFTKHKQQVNEWLTGRPNVQVLDIHYNEILQNPAPDIERINAFLGGGLDTDKMSGVIDPSLYRNRA